MRNAVTVAHRALTANAEAWWRALRYGVVRIGGLLIYFCVLILCVEIARFDPVLSSMVAFGAAMLANYIFSRDWVFRSTLPHRRTFVRYGIVVALAFSLNASIMFIAVYVFGWWYIWGQALAALVVPAFNFVMHSYWSFR